MAMLPCDVCGHRFLGPAGRAYISIFDGGKKWEHKPRLCPEHYQSLIGSLELVSARVEDGKPSLELGPCYVCHGDVTGQPPHSLFVTGYPPRDEREDFFAPICRGHRAEAEIILKGRKIDWSEATEASKLALLPNGSAANQSG